MSDDLRIPAPSLGGRGPVATSYRARRTGPEPGLRMLTIGVVTAGGLLLAGLAGWAMMGRHPAAIPVIEADSRPLRVKPENAGGMQIVGADEQIGGVDKVAPAAEAPAPQALRAQMQQAAPPAPVVEAPTPAPPPVVASPGAASPAEPAPRPVARPAPARPASTGTMVVQLAALDSEVGAQTEWQRLAKKMPELLGDRRPTIQKAERDGHPIWRVRTGGFNDVAEATEFCTRLRAKGGNCTIASF